MVDRLDSPPRRVLLVSPHFPPDTTAATHRVRLLAPHLRRYGWEPTVVTIDPRDYEGRLDPDLAALVPPDLRVVRCRAFSARATRLVGIGDLGLRAFLGLYRTCRRLLQGERFDALFITLYPTYPALLGPLLKRRFAVPFVLDYQDPWVGAWGRTVGPGANGRPDLKSRATRAIAELLESVVVREAGGISAVSRRTFEDVLTRNPGAANRPCAEIPLGGDVADFDYLQTHPRRNPHFSASDGYLHVCYVGTLLPLGVETLRAVLQAVRCLQKARPSLYERLRLHFFGTSNQTVAAVPRVLPIAQELGVAECVTEVATRIDYLDALTVLTQASLILLLGSSEAHYTASKLYPALLARRPLLAVYHEASSVVEILRRATQLPASQVVTFNDVEPPARCAATICAALVAAATAGREEPMAVDLDVIADCSARSQARKLAALFDQITQAGSET
jgi:glycosyltransferase involved in cell wall biosynthesis